MTPKLLESRLVAESRHLGHHATTVNNVLKKPLMNKRHKAEMTYIRGCAKWQLQLHVLVATMSFEWRHLQGQSTTSWTCPSTTTLEALCSRRQHAKCLPPLPATCTDVIVNGQLAETLTGRTAFPHSNGSNSDVGIRHGWVDDHLRLLSASCLLSMHCCHAKRVRRTMISLRQSEHAWA